MAIWSRIRRLKSVDTNALADEKFGEEREAFEKKDGWAMFLSAMLCIWLPAVLVLGALAVLIFLIF